jgi:hypothetical protein
MILLSARESQNSGDSRYSAAIGLPQCVVTPMETKAGDWALPKSRRFLLTSDLREWSTVRLKSAICIADAPLHIN